MNKETLLTGLNSKLKGEKVDKGSRLNTEWQLREAVVNLLKDDGIDESIIRDVSVIQSYPKTSYNIEYKGYYIFSFVVSQKKGDSHYHWWGDRCDWYYKEFVASEGEKEDFDFLKEVNHIENTIVAREQAKQNRKQEMVENLKKVKAIFGDKTHEVVDYLSRHWYDL